MRTNTAVFTLQMCTCKHLQALGELVIADTNVLRVPQTHNTCKHLQALGELVVADTNVLRVPQTHNNLVRSGTVLRGWNQLCGKSYLLESTCDKGGCNWAVSVM